MNNRPASKPTPAPIAKYINPPFMVLQHSDCSRSNALNQWLGARCPPSMSTVTPGPILFLFIGVPLGEVLMLTVRLSFPSLIGTLFVPVPSMIVTVSRIVRAIRTAIETCSRDKCHRQQNGRDVFSSACHLNVAPCRHKLFFNWTSVSVRWHIPLAWLYLLTPMANILRQCAGK